MVKKTVIQNHKDLFDYAKTQIKCKTKKNNKTHQFLRKEKEET